MKKKNYAIFGTLFIILSAVLVSGTVFTFLFSGTITADADSLMEYNINELGTWVNAEDYTRDITTSGLVAGETHSFKDGWRISTNLDAGFTVDLDFTFTQDAGNPADMTGISLYYYFWDGTTNTTVYSCIDGVETSNDVTGLLPSGTGTIFCRIIADDHLEEDIFAWDYTTDVTVNTP